MPPLFIAKIQVPTITTQQKEAIFLSASVPDSILDPVYARTADVVAITAAVSALAHVVLGRRPLIWGGHPAIIPMIMVVAEGLGVDYGQWVRLYQSRFFEDEFPEENAKFQNVTYVDAVTDDRDASLLVMRQAMFSENDFKAAVFIGGTGGIIEELNLFHRLQPNAAVLPVASTGGAALNIAQRLDDPTPDLWNELDYVALFHRLLGISTREKRFTHPGLQPASIPPHPIPSIFSMTEPTEQLYGWRSVQHEQAFPGSECIYQAPDGKEISVTNVNHSCTDPGVYKWPDAHCVGPVTKCLRISDRAIERLKEERRADVVKSIHKQVPAAWHSIFRADNLI